MVSVISLAVTVFCALSSAFARSSTGNSVLVVLESKLSRDDYSSFFDGLTASGYELTFRAPKDVTPAAVENDIPSYAHIVLFAPTTKSFSSDLSIQTLVGLLESRTNLLIAVSPTHTPLHALALEFGITPAPAETTLLSHFPPPGALHTTLAITPPTDSKIVSAGHGAVLYSGTAFTLDGNPLQVPILRAPPEAVVADAEGESDASGDILVDEGERGVGALKAGTSLGTVVGFQARNNARVTWVGGVELFSDAFAQGEVAKGVKAANKQFAQSIAKWTFQESLVYRVDNATHHLVGETTPRDHYTINDQVEYELKLSKFDGTKGEWVPYSGITDIQLEFTMLDPHLRIPLPPVTGQAGTYRTRFRAPDRHGVFKFVVDWRRRTGESYVSATTKVPVVPPRHDGYPRESTTHSDHNLPLPQSYLPVASSIPIFDSSML